MNWRASIKPEPSSVRGADAYACAPALSDLVVDHGHDAVAVVDQQGRCLYANTKARTYLENRFLMHLDPPQQVRFFDHGAQDAYRRALLQLADDPRGGALFAVNAGCSPVFQISIAALAAAAPQNLLIMRIRNLAEACAAKVQHATAHFRLTPAESRVLHGTLNGMAPAACAKSTGLKISTVRTHLAALFAKTETNGQAQLVVKIMSLPEV